MDYSLAALKLFSGQFTAVRRSSTTAFELSGILFQRAWIQGIIVDASTHGRLVIDDGSGIVDLDIASQSESQQWKDGMYVMAIGMFMPAKAEGNAVIKVHKIVDLSEFPDREAMWYLEVIEAYKLFYLPLPE